MDGTQTKFLHPGWSAQSGITAALLARSGVTGPAQVFEGRWGLFASHVQDPNAHRDFARINDRLGEHWESRNSSFKPFPAAHVIHPYISAMLRLRAKHGIKPEEVERIECPVTAFIVGIVCEPTAEKFAPASDSHGRVSLQYSLAEALYHRRAWQNAPTARRAAGIPRSCALARRVQYHVDPDYPGPGRFKGAVKIVLKDGARVRRSGRIQSRLGRESDDLRRAAREIRRQRQRFLLGGPARNASPAAFDRLEVFRPSRHRSLHACYSCYHVGMKLAGKPLPTSNRPIHHSRRSAGGGSRAPEEGGATQAQPQSAGGGRADARHDRAAPPGGFFAVGGPVDTRSRIR